jgi:hypothetical protein
MKVVWQNSGDYVDFSPISPAYYGIVEYYITSLQAFNTFTLHPDETLFQTDKFALMHQVLAKANSFLQKCKLEPFDLGSDCTDINSINRLHEKWVKLYIKYPNIGILAARAGVAYEFDQVNHLCHHIEKMFYFVYKNYDQELWQIDNPYDSELMALGKFNIIINYDNLGRCTFNKWQNYDDNVLDIDTNCYEKLGGKLEFNLSRPYTLALPQEYLDFCTAKNVKPTGTEIPLGNFTDDMSKVRSLFAKNIENNLFLSL